VQPYATALADAAHRVVALGPKLFPSEQAFPVAHVALKLELLAAGLWGLPESGESGGGGRGGGGGMGADYVDYNAVGLCRLNQVDPCPITYNLSNP
jgi:hypothetical protein